jgi:hypothetical protein
MTTARPGRSFPFPKAGTRSPEREAQGSDAPLKPSAQTIDWIDGAMTAYRHCLHHRPQVKPIEDLTTGHDCNYAISRGSEPAG